MKVRLIVLSSILIILTALLVYMIPTQKAQLDYGTVSFGRGRTVLVEVARTPAEQEKGLGGHDPLDDRSGMLFVFDHPAVKTFWMKGMTFAIDIIWINNGFVVGIERGVQPPDKDATDLPTYRSDVPVDYVLEVAAGWANRNNLEIGDGVEIDLNLND